MKVDDLDVGMWVTVSDCRVEMPTDFFGNKAQFNCDGRPWQVAAISLPFICVRSADQQAVIDTRRFELVRLQPKYVKAVLSTNTDSLYAATGKRRKKRKRDVSECPRCGNKMPQKLVAPSTWHYVCRVCGLDGGPPPALSKRK